MKGKKNHIAYLLLGSNLGESETYLSEALKKIGNRCGTVINSSRLYESEPWKMDSSNWFLNQVLELETHLTPEQLMSALLEIEHDLGRVRNEDSDEYESRTIDIDVLYYDQLTFESDLIIIPHPKLHERRFALEPMVELNKDMIHPVFKKSQEELLNLCSDSGVVKWKNQK